jgi:hypothetical protein
MISKSYDFSQFATAVKGKAFDDVICDAQQELIYAWRRVARSHLKIKIRVPAWRESGAYT